MPKTIIKRLQLTPMQNAFLNSKAIYRGYVGGRGTGKALALDTPIPTVYGWTTMGEIRPGDRVFDEKGNVCKVVRVGEVQLNRPVAEVEFSDGSVIVADMEHEWFTETKKSRKTESRRTYGPNARNLAVCVPKNFASIKTTAEISETLYANCEVNHSIKNHPGLNLPEADLPIAPYTFGAWLGDGNSGSAKITSADPEILQQIEADGYDCYEVKTNKPNDVKLYSIVANNIRLVRDKETGRFETHQDGFVGKLKALKVFDNKHIPTVYLRSSIRQRFELLKGLMDTDGTIGKNGLIEFCTTNINLAKGFFELLASLGIKTRMVESDAKIKGRYISKRYRFCFSAYESIFKLSRKLNRQKTPKNQKDRRKRRYITSVTPMQSVPVRCIEVDSPSHLFLAGESMIATHNSYIGAYDIIEQTLKGPYGMTSMVVAPTYGVLHDASFKTFCEHIYNFGIDCHINNQQFVARFDKGKSILFRSAERPGRLRGKNLSSIWMDEAGEIDKEVFDIVIACLREGGRQGRISATFTPKGRQHWTYETFGQCKVCQNDIVHCTCAEKPTDVALFRSRTRDNVFLHEGFEDTIRRQYTSKFAQQELEGDFIDMNAGVFERKWFEIVDAAPVEAKRVRSWDKAGTEDGGCYTVGVLMSATKSGLYYVEHVIREQLSAMGRNNLIKQTTEADAARFPTNYEVVIEQEPGSGGKESAEYTIRQLAGHKVFADRPSGDKVERAQPMAVQAEAGNVKLVKAAWNSLYLDELVSFPEGKFADQVDASSAAFNRLALHSKRKFYMH